MIPETSDKPSIIEPAVNPGVPNPVKDFSYYQPRLNGIIADWKSQEVDKIVNRRKVRKNLVNVAEARQKGTILGDETIIPDHTIDFNVRQQKALYVNYIETSRRLLLFKPPGNIPYTDKDEIMELEKNFTDGMRYNRWKSSWFKVFDGACLHGACAVEVIFDPSKPFNCAVEYVSRNDLRFQLNLKNIQSSEVVLRRFEWTIVEVQAMAKRYAFKEEAVQTLERITTDRKTSNDLFEVYRAYFKQDGRVYVAWYTDQYSNSWLSEPRPLELGLFDIDQVAMDQHAMVTQQAAQVGIAVPPYQPNASAVDFYPFFILKYDEPEDEVILDVPGRAALDIQAQEAITSAFSATINGAVRASGLYASAAPNPNGDAPSDRTIGKLKHGEYTDRPLNFFQPAYPNPILMTVIQALSVRNQQQMGRTDFAALTRDDTEKTATEIQAASREQQSLSSMQVNLLATVITDVYELCYRIARSQFIMKLCKGFLTANPSLLHIDYTFAAAGDVEVIQRAEKEQSLKEIWNIAKDTPAAASIFEHILETFFPNESPAWIKEVRAPKENIIGQLAGLLDAVRDRANITPEENAQLEQVLGAAQAMVGAPNNAAAPAQQQGTPQ